MAKDLRKKYKNENKIKIFNQDILNFEIEKKIEKNTIIFGNLPYNISSQILVKVIKFKSWPPNFTDIVFMFQKEMADRIVGKFNTAKYGRLSILSNYRLNIHKKFDVSANCFFPKPKVTSSVIYFKPMNQKLMKTIYITIEMDLILSIKARHLILLVGLQLKLQVK